MAALLKILVLVFAVLNTVTGDCGSVKEGEKYASDCNKYVQCTGNAMVDHYCLAGFDFDANLKTCVRQGTAVPCSLNKDCTHSPNKRFADIETNCTSYYTCQNHHYYSHSFCNPGTVYDENMQLCNWPENVAPPCGTRSVSSVG